MSSRRQSQIYFLAITTRVVAFFFFSQLFNPLEWIAYCSIRKGSQADATNVPVHLSSLQSQSGNLPKSRVAGEIESTNRDGKTSRNDGSVFPYLKGPQKVLSTSPGAATISGKEIFTHPRRHRNWYYHKSYKPLQNGTQFPQTHHRLYTRRLVAG